MKVIIVILLFPLLPSYTIEICIWNLYVIREYDLVGFWLLQGEDPKKVAFPGSIPRVSTSLPNSLESSRAPDE